MMSGKNEGKEPANAPLAGMFQLEDFCKFSESKLWQWQNAYYSEAGIDAWKYGEVPHHITSNPVMGNAYAEMVFAFLQDLAKQQFIPSTVYLLELGAGHGRFCYHFLKHFEKLKNLQPELLPELCYVLTDLAESNIEFWKSHPRLQPFLAKGMIDFAKVDANSVSSIKLEYSGKIIVKGSLEQPVIVIGNYFFDTISSDLFYIKDKQVDQTLVSLFVPEKSKNAAPENLIRQFKLSYKNEPVLFPVYPEIFLNRLLNWYSENIQDSSLYFPVTSLRCLNSIREFSKKGIFLLTADKGYYRKDDLKLNGNIIPVIHGSFSFTMNYHALKMYFENEGGISYFPKQLQNNIQIGALLLINNPTEFIRTRLAFQRHIDDFSPDDYFNLMIPLRSPGAEVNFHQLLSILRFSHYDAAFFREMFPCFLNVSQKITEDQRINLFQAVGLIWEMYYPIGEEGNLPFLLAELLFSIGFYPEAIKFLQLSEEIYGPNASALYNQALCNFGLKDFTETKTVLEKLLKLDPDNVSGLSLLKNIQEISIGS